MSAEPAPAPAPAAVVDQDVKCWNLRGRWCGRVPAAGWAGLAADCGAGLVVYAMAVPQSLAYASLAGIPLVQGMWSTAAAAVAFALFGEHAGLIVGPTAVAAVTAAHSVPSSIMGVNPAPVQAAAPDSVAPTEVWLPHAAWSASIVAAAALSGVLLLAVRWLGMIKYIQLAVSPLVMSGFMHGSAVLIAASQLHSVLGQPRCTADTGTCTLAEEVAAAFRSEVNVSDVLVAAGTLAALVAWRAAGRAGKLRIFRLLSSAGPMVVLIAVAIIGAAGGWKATGVRVVSHVPTGWPHWTVPFRQECGVTEDDPYHCAAWDVGDVLTMVPAVCALTAVLLLETLTIAHATAQRHPRYVLHPDADVLGLGCANAASAAVGAMPVAASFSRTAVSVEAGSRSPLACLLMAGIMLGTALLGGAALESVPQASLAAVVLMGVSSLLEPKRVVSMLRTHQQVAVWTITAVACISLSPGAGIALGTMASLVLRLSAGVVAEAAAIHAWQDAVLARGTARRAGQAAPAWDTWTPSHRAALAKPGVKVLHVVLPKILDCANVKPVLHAAVQPALRDHTPLMLHLPAHCAWGEQSGKQFMAALHELARADVPTCVRGALVDMAHVDPTRPGVCAQLLQRFRCRLRRRAAAAQPSPAPADDENAAADTPLMTVSAAAPNRAARVMSHWPCDVMLVGEQAIAED